MSFLNPSFSTGKAIGTPSVDYSDLVDAYKNLYNGFVYIDPSLSINAVDCQLPKESSSAITLSDMYDFYSARIYPIEKELNTQKELVILGTYEMKLTQGQVNPSWVSLNVNGKEALFEISSDVFYDTIEASVKGIHAIIDLSQVIDENGISLIYNLNADIDEGGSSSGSGQNVNDSNQPIIPNDDDADQYLTIKLVCSKTFKGDIVVTLPLIFRNGDMSYHSSGNISCPDYQDELDKIKEKLETAYSKGYNDTEYKAIYDKLKTLLPKTLNLGFTDEPFVFRDSEVEVDYGLVTLNGVVYPPIFYNGKPFFLAYKENNTYFLNNYYKEIKGKVTDSELRYPIPYKYIINGFDFLWDKFSQGFKIESDPLELEEKNGTAFPVTSITPVWGGGG